MTTQYYLRSRKKLVLREYEEVVDLWLDYYGNYTTAKCNAHKFTPEEINDIALGDYILEKVV